MTELKPLTGLAVLLFAASIFVGCDSVVSVHPIGDVPGEDWPDVELRQLDGIWLLNGKPIYIKYVGGGKMVYAGMQWEEESASFKPHSVPALVRVEDDALYINVRVKDFEGGHEDDSIDEDLANSYLFIRVVLGDDSLILYPPNAAHFAEAVSGGKLKGKIEEEPYSTQVILESDAKTLNTWIDPLRIGEQFMVGEAVVLSRVKGLESEGF